MCQSDPDQPIEVDSESSDYASGSDGGSRYDTSTASLTSSIQQYMFENGRRYHTYFGENKNVMPTDETEQDRLDLHHEIFRILLNGELYLAPIAKRPQRILDVGTGTGIWAIDIADKFPSAEVIGTDLSPIQPSWVPPNCRFEVDDAEKTWLYKPDSFDFIHLRNLAQSISDWPKLMEQAFKCTKPGGWAQIADVDAPAYSEEGKLSEDHPCKRYCDPITEGLEKLGRPHASSDRLRKHLEDAGYVDVHVTRYKQPLGLWPKDKKMKQVGTMGLLNCETAFHAYGMAVFTRVLGMDTKKSEDLCTAAFLAVKNRKNTIFNWFYVAYGRKPEV